METLQKRALFRCQQWYHQWRRMFSASILSLCAHTGLSTVKMSAGWWFKAPRLTFPSIFCKQTPLSCCLQSSPCSLTPALSLSPSKIKQSTSGRRHYQRLKLNQAALARLQSLPPLTSSFSLSKQIFPQIRSKWVFPGGGRSSVWLMDAAQGCSVTNSQQ